MAKNLFGDNPSLAGIQDPAVSAVFAQYPKPALVKLLYLRGLIIEVAAALPGDAALVETLKWGEPSYLRKGGSTLRIHCKGSRPDEVAMYFNCKTKLVETFKEGYGDRFTFNTNRAIVFRDADEVKMPSLEAEIKHCIELTLNYHNIKHLPLLGM